MAKGLVGGKGLQGDKGLQGFERLTVQPIRRRLILRIGGLEGSGKTHLSLTAPGEIAFFDIDRRTEGVLDKFVREGKVIHCATFRRNPTDTQDDSEKIWESFKELYLRALDDKNIRTIVIDTETEMWEVARIARLGRVANVKPHHYGQVNAEYRSLINRAMDTNKNLVMIDKLKKQYVDKAGKGEGQWNGSYEESGFADLGFMMQTNIRTKFSPTDKQFSLEITKSGLNYDVTGDELVGDSCNFPTLAQYILPDSNEEDWV